MSGCDARFRRPEWMNPKPWLNACAGATDAAVMRAVHTDAPSAADLAVLLSPTAAQFLEPMAARAREITGRRFGRIVSLYVPLYLSNYCTGGCAYCGFGADIDIPRTKLTKSGVRQELAAISRKGFDDVLLLTGDRTPKAGFDYVRDCVRIAADRFHSVAVETFPMSVSEYRRLAASGCTGVTLYQETYDPVAYASLHTKGDKRDYAHRLDSPSQVLEAGIRTLGVGALLGLSEPVADLICLFLHVTHLRRKFWKAGITVSFPRIRPQRASFSPEFPVDERFLTQAICAFRICLPDVPLVLSTRESSRFRDGMAGIGICRMSVASRTTVGGYAGKTNPSEGQFEISDDRDVQTFCAALNRKGLMPVFKDWDSAYRAAER